LFDISQEIVGQQRVSELASNVKGLFDRSKSFIESSVEVFRLHVFGGSDAAYVVHIHVQELPSCLAERSGTDLEFGFNGVQYFSFRNPEASKSVRECPIDSSHELVEGGSDRTDLFGLPKPRSNLVHVGSHKIIPRT